MIAELRGINYYCGNKWILRDINFKINQGEHWVVLGNNGSGKTTLASILSGYRGGYEGEVWLWEEKINNDNVVFWRQKIGFLSDSYFLNCYQHELGLEIILGAMSGQLGAQGDITDDDKIRAQKLLKALGLGKKGEYAFDLLSKGQQQKVLLARALLARNEFLVFDEALNGLDIASQKFMMNTLQDILADKKTSLLYITHHVDEVLDCFSHALLLKNGEIYAMGELKEVVNSTILTGFFANKVDCFWQNGHLELSIMENKKLAPNLCRKGE